MHKIVLVEDDETMLSLLQTLLQMEGFQVVKMEQETIEGILSVLRAEKPALTLMDVHLRQANGFDLLSKIREEPELKDMRVVMSSGMDFTSQCLLAGADDFILKPYMPDELIIVIRKILENEADRE